MSKCSKLFLTLLLISFISYSFSSISFLVPKVYSFTAKIEENILYLYIKGNMKTSLSIKIGNEETNRIYEPDNLYILVVPENTVSISFTIQ